MWLQLIGRILREVPYASCSETALTVTFGISEETLAFLKDAHDEKMPDVPCLPPNEEPLVESAVTGAAASSSGTQPAGASDGSVAEPSSKKRKLVDLDFQPNALPRNEKGDESIRLYLGMAEHVPF